MAFLSGLRSKLKETFRFIIVHDETYEQVGNYKLTLGRLILFGLIIGAVLILVTSILIVFTPLREFIPGYTDEDMKKEHAEMVKLADELKVKVAKKDSFLLILQNMYRLEQPDSMLTLGANLLGEGGSTSTINWKKPVEGKLIKKYDAGAKHYGIDMSAPRNATVSAAADGHIIFAEYSKETGYVIAMQHTGNAISLYKHNKKLLKKVGAYVLAGEPIATVGNTGTLSTGPHLHFQIWERGNAVDPLKYVSY